MERTDMPHSLPPPERNPEAGSAYIVALLVVVVMTIIGLGLALVAQTEMLIGANEKIQSRIFYASDSGIQRSIGNSIYNYVCDPLLVNVQDAGSFNTEVVTSSSVELIPMNCDLCAITNEQYGETQYFEVHQALTSEALHPRGRVRLGTIYSLQPFQSFCKPDYEELANPSTITGSSYAGRTAPNAQL